MLSTVKGTRSRVSSATAKPLPKTPRGKSQAGASPGPQHVDSPESQHAQTLQRGRRPRGWQFELVAALRRRGATLQNPRRGRDEIGARHGVGIHHQKCIGARAARRLKAAAKRHAFAAHHDMVQLHHARAGSRSYRRGCDPCSCAPPRSPERSSAAAADSSAKCEKLGEQPALSSDRTVRAIIASSS